MPMKLYRYEKMLFSLLGNALNGIPVKEELFDGRSEQEWLKCYELAADQGVMGIAWDAVMALPAEIQPPKALKIRWALAVENYDKTYQRYCRTAGELSEFYARHGIGMVQMKGVGLSTYYPVPSRRQGGDIDIYTYSLDHAEMTDAQANEMADQLMRDKGVEVEMHSYKHSNFFFKGIPVENHKFFLNVEHYSASAEADKLLHDHLNPTPVTLEGGYEINIPSKEFNSIFIIVHALQHFTTGLALHHLCDWACVLNKVGQDLPLSVGEEPFRNAVRAMTQLCRQILGTDVPEEYETEKIEEILLKEMVRPKFHKSTIPEKPLSLIWYKTRRFVYSARLRSKVWDVTFPIELWRSIVAHLKDPSTILAR